jgi:hypothetical protein
MGLCPFAELFRAGGTTHFSIVGSEVTTAKERAQPFGKLRTFGMLCLYREKTKARSEHGAKD